MTDSTDDIAWEVPVDNMLKCPEFKPFKFYGVFLCPHCGRRKKTNPHMRGFWAATLAFTFAFIAWFAFAPIMFVVRKDIGICDNAHEVALDVERTDCVCGPGCRQILNNAKIAAVSLDVFTRFILGAVIERMGPRRTDVMLLFYGSVVVACSAAVTSGPGLVVARFFVSSMGSTFVVNQFWNSILFCRSVVGTANATAGGWGNLGGGMTQILMPFFYRVMHDVFGVSLGVAWRLAMIGPALMCAILALFIYFGTQDTPKGKFDVRMVGKDTTAGIGTYVKCMQDYRVVLMIFQYGACFGCELVMNNTLASYFQEVFKVDMVSAGALAMAFGGMNLFARSLGGIVSDWANAHWAMKGRLWAHFFALLLQGVMMFWFASVTPEQGVGLALFVLCCFATFVNAAEGTSYGIVPYMIPQDVAVVSAVVGAGGTLGSVIALGVIYNNTADDATGMMWHSVYIVFWALTVFGMQWEEHGSMFRGSKQGQSSQPEKTQSVDQPPAAPVPVEAAAPPEAGNGANIDRQVGDKTNTLLLEEMLVQMKGLNEKVDALSATPQQIQQLEVKVDNQHADVVKEIAAVKAVSV